MKITRIDTFQLYWDSIGKGGRSAFVRIEVENGVFGLGEASPMQGGVASLGMIGTTLRLR